MLVWLASPVSKRAVNASSCKSCSLILYRKKNHFKINTSNKLTVVKPDIGINVLV